ncbi:MAG TPA: hypothetical protein VNL94_00600 [Candidatus Binatia bacterium]|nr:hypothetical protein [Candidatus Binatia bacterium]
MTGLELRECWEEGVRTAVPRFTPGAAAAPEAEVPAGRAAVTVRGNGGPLDRPDPMRLRGFVPLDELASANPPAAAGQSPNPSSAPATTDAAPPLPPALLADVLDWESRPTLFGEPER